MTSATVRHSIRLADGDAAYRVAAWQELMLTSGRVEVTPEEAERFVSESSWRRLGPVMIGRISASDFRLVRTEEAASRSGLDHVFINVFETGSGHGVCGRRSVVFDVGSLSVTKLSSAADYHLKGITFTVLVMPRRLMETAVGPVDTLDGRVFTGSTPEAVIIGAHIRALLDLPEALPQAKAALAGRTCLSLLSACFSKPTPRAVIGIDPDAELAKTIRSYIEEHLADPDLGSVRICEQFGLSRSRLYRLMSASGDVAASIRRLRVLRAHREIASRRMMDRSMPEIAACFGFSQERSFRRVFHQAFGYTPSQLQGRVRTGASVSLPGSGAVVDDWFNGL